MGTKLSVEEAVHLTVNDLGVEQSHVHCWRSNNIIKSTCLVIKWICPTLYDREFVFNCLASVS